MRLFPRTAVDFAFWLLAILPLLLLASFVAVLVSVQSARAEETAACKGNNIIETLRANDPAAYQRVVDEAARTPNGKGNFWKIEKQGVSPSFLMGTMHVTDPRVLAMSPAAKQAHAGADTIVIESDEILDEKKAAAALLMKPELTMFTDGTTISKLLSAKDAETLASGLKARGIALPLVDRMKPWMIASFVALPACEVQRKADGAAFLDKKLAEDALAMGKQVKGLETLAEQLSAMAELPVEFHLQALIETIKIGDRMNDVIETMTDLYLSGDTGMTLPMLKTVSPEDSGDDAGSYAAFEQRIIIDRNHVMAERAGPLLAKGNVFIAVGALHLPGADGLVELLRKQGFTVTAVN
ncbi:TraB/GumN family protein [Rhizobiaceae bacterium n13]|uniref:TraB/GumN family protein n=2 Tax=Ferirhizobium litorale TaxID=2927786 RepID=A0AAE3U3B7_9HYPH|nr:TraB/GumN family protein [Fererhizobium litorale]MDI7862476.1 TraB/GumN family protein [Fererhizobium litorale]MDI7923637.1 TraB/GumN family protein [Fererhizobium litorale]